MFKCACVCAWPCSGYRAIFMSWAEMMLATNWTNGTEVMAAACEGFKDALGPNGTAVFGYNQGQVAPLFYPEVLELTRDLGKYGDYFLGYDKVTNSVTMNSTTFCSQMNVKPVRVSFRCLSCVETTIRTTTTTTTHHHHHNPPQPTTTHHHHNYHHHHHHHHNNNNYNYYHNYNYHSHHHNHTMRSFS
jgi:hypothetical protein